MILTQRVHPFPFRTRKLSSAVAKILVWRRTGKIAQCRHSVSDLNAEGPPVPIPNTEVKLSSVENTSRETVREDRSRPTSRTAEGQFSIPIWGCSSAGRAPALQAGGHGFESHHLHQRRVAVPRKKGHSQSRDKWIRANNDIGS